MGSSQKKRSTRRKQAQGGHAQGRAGAGPRWRQLLLLATAVPMLAVVGLFVASWFDVVLFGTPESQTVVGAAVALLGFAAANGLQKLWRLAAGWLCLAAGVLLVAYAAGNWLMWPGAAVAAVGLVLVLWAFAERYRQVRRSQ